MSAAPAQGNTVTLAVAQGESLNPTATFSQAMAARQVSIGAGAAAQWKVRAQGVEPVHAELYWDGAVLWVRDAGSLSGVYVGTERALDWVQVFDGAEVAFGQCLLRARVTGPAAKAPAGAPVNAASAAFIDEEESTMVFSSAPGMMQAAELMSAARRSNAPPTPAPAPAPSAPSFQHGRIATMAPQRSAGPVALPPTPSLPVESDPSIPAKPTASEATVIRPSPYAALLEGAAPGPNGGMHPPLSGGNTQLPTVMVTGSQVGLPAAAPPGMIRPATMAPPLVAGGLQPAPLAAAPPPPMGPMGPMSGMGPMGPMSGMGPMGPMSGMGPMGPMSGMAPPGMGPMQSAPPPSFGDDPFGTVDIPSGKSTAKDGGKTVGGVPTRTLLLAGVTLLVGVGGLFINPAPAQQPQRQGATAGATAGPTNQRVLTQGGTPPSSNNILGLPIGPSGIVGVVVPAPMQTTDAQGRPRALPPPNPADPIRQAADAVHAHRYDDAARLYEQLAAQHPEAPLFRQFATVLRARATQQGCTPGAPGCTAPTAPTEPPSPAAPSASP